MCIVGIFAIIAIARQGIFAIIAMDFFAIVANNSDMSDLEHQNKVWLAEQLATIAHGERAKVAGAAGVSPTQLSRMANIDPKAPPKNTQNIPLAKLRAFADYFKTAPPGLAGVMIDPSAATVAPVTQEVFPGPDIEFDRHGPRDVPVLGTAMGGTEDDERPVDFWLTGEIENHVLRPKGLANARNVFVLHVGGDSMEPRFEERDMVYVQKTSPGIGDDVVIELHPIVEGGDHPTFIKRLVRRNGSFITVKQYNPPKELEFTMKEIKNLFRVIPLKELMG
jgi:hypothetical protein